MKPAILRKIQETQINHSLYADDLVLLSLTKEGLQNCLDRLQNYCTKNSLIINIDKTKTMIFNYSGKLIQQPFVIGHKKLEQVQTFCYLGFEVKASGVISLAAKTLYDKANKAMRPLMGVISRFNLSARTSLQLFHTYIAPIMLYASQNWLTMSTKKLQSFSRDTIFLNTFSDRVDNLHRSFLKYILGTSKSCPNMAVYGETGEIPLSIKGYRLMLNYWYRLTKLPDDNLAKMALLENSFLRTNWIITIEKLLNFFNLTELPRTLAQFKAKTNKSISNKFINFWGEYKTGLSNSRLDFYDKIKLSFGFENYLDLPSFSHRKTMTKLRCSDHTLEVEKGRHKKIPREGRLCKMCDGGEVETEEHFLMKCNAYDSLRLEHLTSRKYENIHDLLNETDDKTIIIYLIEALSKRKETYENLKL